MPIPESPLHPAAKLVLTPMEWPEAHRRHWEAGTAPRAGRLARPKHADGLRPHSIRNAARAWGAFLAALAASGMDTDVDPPAALVTPDNVAIFVDGLVTRANKPTSIRTRLFDLRVAARILQPAAALDWLTRPGDTSINELFDGEPEPKEPLDPRELTRLGHDLMACALAASQPDVDALRNFRNGLIFALLAALPIRIGSLALMRLGVNVFDSGTEILVRFAPHETKNHRRLETALPEHLVGSARRYLAEIRPLLVTGIDERWVWLNADGSRFLLGGIATMFRRTTERAFGTASGPHLSRHGMATALADIALQRPGLAAAVLGVGEGVVDRHYRRAEMLHAARVATGLLEAERDELRLRARTRFGDRASD